MIIFPDFARLGFHEFLVNRLWITCRIKELCSCHSFPYFLAQDGFYDTVVLVFLSEVRSAQLNLFRFALAFEVRFRWEQFGCPALLLA